MATCIEFEGKKYTIEEFKNLLDSNKDGVESSTAEKRLTQEVQELFKANPELANSVYAALGFGQESNLPTSDETINIYAGSNQNAELSNFAIRPFTINVETPSGEKQYTFQSVEQGFHFYKALVANNPQVAKQILATTNGGQLKRLTNRSNLKMTPEQVKEWDDTSKSIMLNLMYDSYAQNPKAAEKLLATGNAKITHTQDKTRWKTDFPEVVMTVRDMLREEGFGTQPQITPEQKQQAQQLYSEYLEQNPNGNIEGFKEFISNNQTSTKKGVSELFKANPDLANEVYEAAGFGKKSSTKTNINKKKQKELDKTDLYEYDRKFKEFQTYGNTVKEAFDNLFEQVKNNPTNKELSDFLDYINDRLVSEDIQEGSYKNPLVQEYIDENQQSIEKASKSTKSRISKINAKYDYIEEKLELAKTETQEHLIALFANEKITKEQLEQYWDSSLETIYKEIFNSDGYSYINLAENKVTPEQKQQAQQLYSQYLEQNPDGNIEGFKEFVKSVKQIPTSVESNTTKEKLVSLREKFLNEGKTSAENTQLTEQQVDTVLEVLEKRDSETTGESATEQIQTVEENMSPLPDGGFSDTVVDAILKNNDTIEGLSLFEEYQTVQHMAAIVNSLVPIGETRLTREVFEEVRKQMATYLFNRKKANNTAIENLKTRLDSENEVVSNIIKSLEKENEKIDTVLQEDNWQSLEKKTRMKILGDTGISEIGVENIFDETNQSERNFDSNSLEENGKKQGSYLLKKFYNGVKEQTTDGKTVSYFLGLPSYLNYDTIDNVVKTILTSPNEAPSDYTSMVKILEEYREAYPFLGQIINKLGAASQQLRNTFVSENTKNNARFKFVMFSKERNSESIRLQVYDSNANDLERVIIQKWNKQFLSDNNIITFDEITKEFKINKKVLKTLSKKYEDLVKNFNKNKIEIDKILEFLNAFGINITEDTARDLIAHKFKAKGGKISFRAASLTPSPNSSSILSILGDYINKTLKQDGEIIITDDNISFYNPLTNANNALKVVAAYEGKRNLFHTTTSFRDNGKNFNAKPIGKFYTENANKLKTEETWRKAFAEKAFSQNSAWLKALENPTFRQAFEISYIGNTAIKEFGKKVFGDKDITSLSQDEKLVLRFGLLQDLKQNVATGLTYYPGTTLPAKYIRTLAFTMADKSNMFAIGHIGVDIKAAQYENNSPVIDLIVEQCAKSELNRILDFLKRGGQTDIENYDTFAGFFLQMPFLNTITIAGPKGDIPIYKILNKGRNGSSDSTEALQAIAEIGEEQLISQFEEKAKERIREFVNAEVKKTYAAFAKNFLVTDPVTKQQTITYLDAGYLKNLSATEDVKYKLNIAAFDFVVNNLLSYSNQLQLFTGDLALYGQASKAVKLFVDGNLDVIKDEALFTNSLVYDYVDVNFGKRLASMIAPRNKIANSKSDEYLQVFLKDLRLPTENLSELARIHYDETAKQEVSSLFNQYQNTTDSLEASEILKSIGEKYPLIKDYLDIQTTDAQEYTTVKEHVEVLFRRGYLSDEIYETLSSKIKNKENFTDEELKIVLQPLKPVYTGFLNDSDTGTMRFMYVKSSSYPLLPQVTKDFEIDKLRQQLEALEEKHGKSVRASYGTANKVGAIAEPLSIWNTDGTFNDAITSDHLFEFSKTLSRDNFGLQQDIPPKFTKGVDKVSIATQMLKLLMGNGVRDIVGDEVFTNYTQSFLELLQLKEDKVRRDFSIEFGKGIETFEQIKNLQNLLVREALERNYPRTDIQALNIIVQTTMTDGEGNVKKVLKKLNSLNAEEKENITDWKFQTPIWTSPNANRYEALLNAIISKRLVNIKLPGESFVVGSETGYKLQKDLSGVDTSRIVYTASFQGELKSFSEEGGVKTTQVFVPSRFRDNKGELIKFFDEQGKPNSTYIEEKDGRFFLKEDMIEEELLNLITYRIPTSSHVNMSKIQIAGFLPPEVGDLMIVPKSFIIQKGLDFDIDKENSYRYHHYVDAQGKIKILKDYELTEEEISDFEEYYKEIKKKHFKNTSLRNRIQNLEDEIQTLEEMGFEAYKESLASLERLKDKEVKESYTEEELKEYENAYIAYKHLKDNTFREKILENKIVEVHMRTLENPKVQSLIQKSLSIEEEKTSSIIIDETLKANKDLSNFTMLSALHQDAKMELGAVGKMGIGVYANALTFLSLAQQNEEQVSINTTEGKLLQIQIDNKTYTGDLKSVVGNGRRKATILEGRANTATDNEKEQIMGKVNINAHTINVDVLLSLMGVDSTTVLTVDNKSQSIQFSYLLLSQPILREFSEEMAKVSSSLTDYTANAEQKIYDKLIVKYGGQSQYSKVSSQNIQGQELYNSLTEVNNDVQLKALKLYRQLNSFTPGIRMMQSILGINKEGVGMSFFNTIEKYEALVALGKNGNKTITNAESLIGAFETISKANLEEYLSEGYKVLKEIDQDSILVVKPKTIIGGFVVNALTTGYNMWSELFPYNRSKITKNLNKIMSLLGKEEVSQAKRADMKMEIFNNFKKFLFSTTYLESNGEDITQTRQRLCKDIPKQKQSLASYLKDVLESKEKSLEFLRQNSLLSSLEFNIDFQKYSTITYNNAKHDDFDEGHLYQSLIMLVNTNKKLPDFNGETYSTRQLVKDLVQYAYSTSGLQEAKEFIKYIPTQILTALHITADLRLIHETLMGNGSTIDNMFEKFSEQYIRHNPNLASKLDANLKFSANFTHSVTSPKNVATLTGFQLTGDSVEYILGVPQYKPYVSIYNKFAKRGDKKYRLFKHIGEGHYKSLQTLGTEGVVEYDADTSVPQSYVSTGIVIPQKATSTTTVKTQKETEINPALFGLSTGAKVEAVLQEMLNEDLEKSEFLTPILEYFSTLNLEGVQIVVNPDMSSFGAYDSKTQTISINPKVFNSSDSSKSKTISVFVKELTHHFTVNFIKDNPENVAVKELGMLMNFTRKEMEKSDPNFSAALKEVERKVNAAKMHMLQGTTSTENLALTQYEFEEVYPFLDIFEFVENFFTSKVLQNKLNSVPYRKSGRTILQKIYDIVAKLFSNLTKGNVSSEIISNIVDIIEQDSKGRTLTSMEKIAQENQNVADQLYNDDFTDIFSEDSGQDLSPTGEAEKRLTQEVQELFKANPELANAVYEALGFGKGNIKGINIRTDKTNRNSLANRLTNPNWYSVGLMDVEAPYKANASKIKAPHLNAEEALKYDMNLMYKLQVQKFRKNPELIDEINDAGGLEFIKNSSHIVGVKNSRWEGVGMNSNFIKVLAKSYETVAKELGKFKVITINQTTSQQKQEAQTKFQEYVDATGRQDIEGFKEFINNVTLKSSSTINLTPETDFFSKNGLPQINIC